MQHDDGERDERDPLRVQAERASADVHVRGADAEHVQPQRRDPRDGQQKAGPKHEARRDEREQNEEVVVPEVVAVPSQPRESVVDAGRKAHRPVIDELTPRRRARLKSLDVLDDVPARGEHQPGHTKGLVLAALILHRACVVCGGVRFVPSNVS